MKRGAVGFYWTLPVPWAGFTELPSSIEDAAQHSQTIGFQRKLIHDFALRHGLALVHEAAFLEIDPDRGSTLIHQALDKAAVTCREHAAVLLFVDFSSVQGWRSHEPMLQWLRDAEIETLPIEAQAVSMSGRRFDPFEHFAEWRCKQREWTDGKGERAAVAYARAVALRSSGLKNPAIAQILNEEGVRSLSGRPWSADSVRKFIASAR